MRIVNRNYFSASHVSLLFIITVAILAAIVYTIYRKQR
jgi:hypothetical protein